MPGLLNKPRVVKALPVGARRSVGPKANELTVWAEGITDALKATRDQFALVATDLETTSSVYEALRKAGCEVRLARVNPDGTPKPTFKKTIAGVERHVPLTDIYALLPAGEVVNRSGRKPWTPPDKRLAALQDMLKANVPADHRAKIQAAIDKIYANNPKLRPSATA